MTETVFSGTILALDLASTTGWAFGPADPKAGKIICNSERLGRTGADNQDKFMALMRWLHDGLKTLQPTVVVYEAPVAVSTMAGKTTVATTQLLFGLPAIVQVCCGFAKTPVRHATVSDVRQYWIGRRNMKGKDAKPEIRRQLVELGWSPPDLDASDALALHRFYAAKLIPSLAVEASPLFKPAAKKPAKRPDPIRGAKVEDDGSILF